MAHETTLYSVLRIPETASSEDIKQAYRKLAKLWHPDLHPDDMSAGKRMQEITEAYTVLSDPAKKWKYDETLQRQRAALVAKQQEQARRAAQAAAAAAAAKAAHVPPVNRKPYVDPDRPPRTPGNYESSYEDFTVTAAPSVNNAQQSNSPFVVNNAGSSKPAPGRAKNTTVTQRTGAVENLTDNERRMEDLSIALCVIFPVLIPIVYKHMKESSKMYPGSFHYQDALLSMRIVAGFSIPLWLLLIFLVIKTIMGPHV